MDERRRLLERKFHQDRDFHTACKIIHMDWSLDGVFNLREQAARLDLTNEDAWDCAKFYESGTTQALVDATHAAMLAEANGAIQFGGVARDGEYTSNLYTNRSGPDSLLREVDSLATANSYYGSWNISIRNVDTRRRAGPEDVIQLSIEDHPLYRSMPSLMITGVPDLTGSANTIEIYVQELEELPRIIHALHLIALMIYASIHLAWGADSPRWRDHFRYGPQTIDEVEAALRKAGSLQD